MCLPRMQYSPCVPEIELPTDLAAAHALILELHAECHELRGQYEDVKHQLDQMARRMYGRRSEQLDPAQLQMAFAALRAVPSDSYTCVACCPA